MPDLAAAPDPPPTIMRDTLPSRPRSAALLWLPLVGALALAHDTPRRAPADLHAVADPELAPPGRPSVPTPHAPEVLAARRARLAAELGEGLLVIAAGDEEKGRFEVHSDFLYLTGIEVPDAVLILGAADGERSFERLYLPERDERKALWDGPLLGPGERAQALAGLEDTRGRGRLEADLDELLATPGVPVFALSEQRRVLFGPPPDGREVAARSPREALNALQAVKDAGELAALQASIDITQAALADGFSVARPLVYEFQVEAAIEAGFRRRGAPFRAFPSIVGSGPNACILHYRDNERRMGAGELLLLDVGAKVHGYSADISRTIPLEDRFSPRQRELYELVVRAHDAAAAVLRPGASIREAHEAARAVFAEHDLAAAFRHSVGHHLGLRVHDVPGFRGPLAAGMVVTIEPGLYLPEEAIGIRIENDFLVTEDGARLLSSALPYRTDELEAYLLRLRGKP